jgi:hypothetical protein
LLQCSVAGKRVDERVGLPKVLRVFLPGEHRHDLIDQRVDAGVAEFLHVGKFANVLGHNNLLFFLPERA